MTLYNLLIELHILMMLMQLLKKVVVKLPHKKIRIVNLWMCILNVICTKFKSAVIKSKARCPTPVKITDLYLTRAFYDSISNIIIDGFWCCSNNNALNLLFSGYFDRKHASSSRKSSVTRCTLLRIRFAGCLDFHTDWKSRGDKTTQNEKNLSGTENGNYS